MIKIFILKENNYYKEVKITGHADYEEYGKDIVCAAVSGIVITTVNAILSFDKLAIQYTVSSDLMIKVNKNTKITNKLLENMINLLKELKKDYPKTIKFL